MNSKPLILKNDLDDKVSEFLEYLLEYGGPKLQDYEKFTLIVNSLDPADVDEFREKIKTILNVNTLIGHAFVKPYGYPGDFILLNKIYQFDASEDPRYKNWDLLFQNQPAAYAVRNRKDFFIKYCKDLVVRKENAKVLILGSGPASDVYEFLTDFSGGNNINIDLIDFDPSAIDFSMKKTRSSTDKLPTTRLMHCVSIHTNCMT
jgi:extracellular factor (EF) 3-hydroxypalmitic acid methyl ester biosynthesis protein